MELNTADVKPAPIYIYIKKWQPEDQSNVDLQKTGRHKEQTQKQKLDALVHTNIQTNTHIHNHIHIFSHLQLACPVLTPIQTFFLIEIKSLIFNISYCYCFLV